MAKFCADCGTAIETGEKFCSVCGASIVAGQTLTQSSHAEQTQEQARGNETKKKKSKAPLIFGIGSGAVVTVALIVVMVVTNVFGLLNKPDGGENNEGGAVYNDDGELIGYFDGEIDSELYLVPYRSGDRELILEWLRVILAADDYYSAVNCGSYLSPVEMTDEPRSRLDGYPVSGRSGQTNEPDITEFPDDAPEPTKEPDDKQPDITVPKDDEAPDMSLPIILDNDWPAEYLPKNFPVYPGDIFNTSGEPGIVAVEIEATSTADLSKYLKTLQDAGWAVNYYIPGQITMGDAKKGLWKVMFVFDDPTLLLTFYYDM